MRVSLWMGQARMQGSGSGPEAFWARALRSPARTVHALMTSTTQILAEQTQMYVALEQEIAQLQPRGHQARQLALDDAYRIQMMERINEVLHANLTAAQQYVVLCADGIIATSAIPDAHDRKRSLAHASICGQWEPLWNLGEA